MRKEAGKQIGRQAGSPAAVRAPDDQRRGAPYPSPQSTRGPRPEQVFPGRRRHRGCEQARPAGAGEAGLGAPKGAARRPPRAHVPQEAQAECRVHAGTPGTRRGF